MHDEPTGLGIALQSPERKCCSACQQVNPCTDFSSTNRGGGAPARSTHRRWASSSADLSTLTASRESYRTVSHHSVRYSALKRPLRIVCLRHGATTAPSRREPDLRRWWNDSALDPYCLGLRPLRLWWHAFGRLLLLALSWSRLRWVVPVVPVVPVVDPGLRGRQQ